MKKVMVLILLSLFLTLTADAASTHDIVVDDTPEKSNERMARWKHAKFGMFVLWGVYSQAKGECNGETHHAEWIKIIKDAGMKYLVITSKHHDGFAMFNSPCNSYNIVQGSAFKDDPIIELAEACEKLYYGAISWRNGIGTEDSRPRNSVIGRTIDVLKS